MNNYRYFVAICLVCVSCAARATDDAPAPAVSASAPADKHADCPMAAASAPDSALAALESAPCTVKFDALNVGLGSAAQRVVLSAGSSEALGSVEIRASGDFAVSPAKCDLIKAGSCALSVSFNPVKVGLSQGAITVMDSAGTGSRVVTHLQGQGTKGHQLGGLLLVVGLYVLALINVRWNKVALPTRRLLLVEIHAATARMDTLKASGQHAAVDFKHVEDLLKDAKAMAPPKASFKTLLDLLFWSRGQETAGWGLVHESEKLLVPFLEKEDLRSDLETSQVELRELGTACALDLADRIKGGLPALGTPAHPHALARLRALQAEALGVRYDRGDTDFCALVSWHNKAIWLVSCALLLIVALAAALGNEVLFLMGAAGGLFSRLSRNLYRQDVPTDYGASWTTLFLSPVVGALAGWSGVLLVALAVKLQALGPLFAVITWDNPFNVFTLGVALLLGTSERAFDRVLNALNDKVVGAAPAASVAPLVITTTTLKPCVAGQPYDQKLEASGGKAPYTWSHVGGSLTSGLKLSDDHIVGTPEAATSGAPGTASNPLFTLQVRDSTHATAIKQFSM